ncbi:MAG: AbrB/MazE/SpoVT family DNA-binding domain-containing protein [Propionibacteriaceae bacterium]|nr:AbrB/MazE/SpoVT family DNA-binding domain-containing protein [Propionibacteriaceae bacterium]
MATHAVTMAEKGRVVVPARIRERHGWGQGSALVFVETDAGVLISSASDALAKFRASVAGTSSPVVELIAERRAEADSEKRDTIQ